MDKLFYCLKVLTHNFFIRLILKNICRQFPIYLKTSILVHVFKKHHRYLKVLMKIASAYLFVLIKSLGLDDQITSNPLAADGVELNTAQTAGLSPKHPKSCSTLPPWRNNGYKHDKRAMKRRKIVESNGHIASDNTKFEHVQIAIPMHTELKTKTLPTKCGAYGSLPLHEPASSTQRMYSLEQLMLLGFSLVQ